MPTGCKRIKDKYDALPEAMQIYFNGLPLLMVINHKCVLDIIIAYLFMRIERGQRNILYGAVVKKHKVSKDLANETFKDFHMKRHKFLEFYKKLADGKPIDDKIISYFKTATPIRDLIMHGRDTKENNKEIAIYSILDYTYFLNEQSFEDFKFRPFSAMEEFEQDMECYDDIQSRQILQDLEIPPPSDIEE